MYDLLTNLLYSSSMSYPSSSSSPSPDSFEGFLESLGKSGIDASALKGLLAQVGGMIVIYVIMAFAFAIALGAFAYMLKCYITMFIGRKAGLKNDWFAYIPVAHSIYRMDIVREPRWKILFIGGVSVFLRFLLCAIAIWAAVSGGGVFIIVVFGMLLFIYTMACIYFCYMYNRKLFYMFGYNPDYAFIGLAADICAVGIIFIPGILCMGAFGAVLMIVLNAGASMVIAARNLYYAVTEISMAFNDRIQTGNNTPSGGEPPLPNPDIDGKMVGVSGMYQGAEFPIDANFEIIVGRDSYFSSIVITDGANTISRKHCGISFDRNSNSYIVTDYSSNGTFKESGERFQRNVPDRVPRGSVISLGDKTNKFKLM